MKVNITAALYINKLMGINEHTFDLSVAVMFMFVKNKDSPRSGNIFMWVGLFLGNGMLMCAYSMEWYARQTCPPKQVGGSMCAV